MVESVSSRKPLVNSDNSNQNSMSLNKFDNSSIVLFHSGIKSDNHEGWKYWLDHVRGF